MASKYFSGTAPTSYLPPGFMESATAPGRYYAEAMGSIGKAVGAGLAKRNQRKKDKAYFDFIERMGETPTSRTEVHSWYRALSSETAAACCKTRPTATAKRD